MTWARRKSSTYSGPNTFELRKGGVVLATIQECAGGWFSYGMGEMFWNTSKDPKPFIDAKEDAVRRVREASKATA
jgi:hypothetical protein